jgi:hypothetical protein
LSTVEQPLNKIAATLVDLQERYAKALEVVEAARDDDHQLCPDVCGCCTRCGRMWPCPTSVALAAFDKVADE